MSSLWADAIGWSASAILVATLSRQIWVQWREESTQGISGWLFAGQIATSIGFIAYSVLVGSLVFIVCNSAILLTAIIGQAVYRRNLQLDRAAPGGSQS